jgi:hypothetical protein
LPDWLNEHNKLEVFHWMTEWITRPHYSAVASAYEGWLLEACLLNALAAAGASHEQRYYAYHGNLLACVDVGHESIPGSWNVAKRRYSERCAIRTGAVWQRGARTLTVAAGGAAGTWRTFPVNEAKTPTATRIRSTSKGRG